MGEPKSLAVTLISARDLHNVAAPLQRMDPYVVVTYAKQRYSTDRAHNQHQTPQWNKSFNLKYVEDEPLKFKVIDKNSVMQDQTIGSGQQFLSDILKKKEDFEGEIELRRPGDNGGKAGKLKVKIEIFYSAPPAPSQPDPPVTEKPAPPSTSAPQPPNPWGDAPTGGGWGGPAPPKYTPPPDAPPMPDQVPPPPAPPMPDYPEAGHGHGGGGYEKPHGDSGKKKKKDKKKKKKKSRSSGSSGSSSGSSSS